MLPIHGSQPPSFSFKEKIVKALSHTWKIITRESSNFIQKISSFANRIFKDKEQKGEILHVPLQTPMQTSPKNPNSGKTSEANLPVRLTTRIDQLIDKDTNSLPIKAQMQKELKSLQESLQLLTQNVDRKACQEKINILKKQILLLQAIDVPDNGNCLYNAIAVGLRKQYSNETHVQNLLNWNISLDELKGDLSNRQEIFAQPARDLRLAASEYAKKNMERSFISRNTKGDIESYIDFKQQQLRSQQDLLPHLELQEKNACNKLIDDLEDQIKSLQGSTGYQIYYDLMNQDGFYSGGIPFAVLSELFEVPLCLISNYGSTDEFTVLFNPTGSTLPPLTIGYVNGNHYVYVMPMQA